MCDHIFKLGGITLSFSFVSQVHLGSNKNAGARLGSGLDFGDPLGACLLETILIDETEAHDKAISVSVSDWPQSSQVFVSSSVPNL